jgi:hypothetical protein
MRRQSTTVEDKDINIEGVVRLTLSAEMQRLLGCVIGKHVSSEMPWTMIRKQQVQANLSAENEKSELFAIKEPLVVIYNNKNILFILHQQLDLLLVSFR